MSTPDPRALTSEVRHRETRMRTRVGTWSVAARVRGSLLLPAALTVLGMGAPMLEAAGLGTPPGPGVVVTRNDAAHRVDITIDGTPFTSYLWETNQRKPVLYPLIAPDGTTVTRGYPFVTVAGERVDHPHHAGLWFNYGNANNFDFWNNSDAIKPADAPKYGAIHHDRIVAVHSGTSSGELTTESTWITGSQPTVPGGPILAQTTRYVFSKLTVGGQSARAVDLIVTLKALDTVVFHDDKEGLLGIRVAHFLESATEKGGVFLDASGNPTQVAAADPAGATGVYHTSEGRTSDGAAACVVTRREAGNAPASPLPCTPSPTSDPVWGTRGRWCWLSGQTTGKTETIAILDHAGNPGSPPYWHARGYGLFAVNPLGAHVFDPKATPMNFTLSKGSSAVFKYRILILSSGATEAEMNRQAGVFDSEYR